MSSKRILKAENLSKVYHVKPTHGLASDSQHADKEFSALYNVSFELKRGDVMGVIGRNGSGKSTLLKILGQIIHPSSGKLSYSGRLMSILDIGSGFHPELSGRENAFMYGAMLGIPKREIQQRMDQIIAFSGIGRFFDEPVKFYSNGMYLRVAFSVAFFTNTDILILDEVLAVGDSEFMIKCHQRIREMIDHGLSIILVSHAMSDVLSLCNKCIWLDKGEVVQSGSPTDVVGAYLQSGWGAYSGEKRKSVTLIEWESDRGPSAEGFALHRVKVLNCPEDPDIDDGLEYNSPIRIEAEFSTIGNKKNFSLILILTDQYNVPFILSTHHFEDDLLFQEACLSSGRYRSHCTIPAKLLNVGAYKLQLKVIQDNLTEILDLPALLMFKISSKYPRQNKGLLATPITLASHLDWQTEAI